MPFARVLPVYREFERAKRPDYHGEFARASEPRVQQISLKHHEMLGMQRHHHRRVFRTLRFVNAQGISQTDFIQFPQIERHIPAVETHGKLPVDFVDCDNNPKVSVINLFFIVVVCLQNTVADPELLAEPLHSDLAPVRVEGCLQSPIERRYSQFRAVHGSQHLNIAHRIEPELFWNALAHQQLKLLGNICRIFRRHKKEIIGRHFQIG